MEGRSRGKRNGDEKISSLGSGVGVERPRLVSAMGVVSCVKVGVVARV